MSSDIIRAEVRIGRRRRMLCAVMGIEHAENVQDGRWEIFWRVRKEVMKMRKKDELELKEYDIEPLYGQVSKIVDNARFNAFK